MYSAKLNRKVHKTTTRFFARATRVAALQRPPSGRAGLKNYSGTACVSACCVCAAWYYTTVGYIKDTMGGSGRDLGCASRTLGNDVYWLN